MLNDYRKKTHLPCNAHTFRMTFASNLHRRGVDVEHIMRLGGWETLDMVVRYTKSVEFDDSLQLNQDEMKIYHFHLIFHGGLQHFCSH